METTISKGSTKFGREFRVVRIDDTLYDCHGLGHAESTFRVEVDGAAGWVPNYPEPSYMTAVEALRAMVAAIAKEEKWERMTKAPANQPMKVARHG